MLTRCDRIWLVLVFGFCVALFGCSSEPVTAPTSFANWAPNDPVYFHIQYPEGWKAEGGGKQGLQWAEFTKGNAMISVSTDVKSSVIGDIAGAGGQLGGDFIGGLGDDLGGDLGELGGGGPSAEDMTPVAKVHELKLNELPGDYKSYKEEPAQSFKSKLGDGRKSVFTASVGLGRKVKGYRATVLGLNRGITVFCYCPQKEWEKLQPAYDKVLESLAGGGL